MAPTHIIISHRCVKFPSHIVLPRFFFPSWQTILLNSLPALSRTTVLSPILTVDVQDNRGTIHPPQNRPLMHTQGRSLTQIVQPNIVTMQYLHHPLNPNINPIPLVISLLPESKR